MSLSRLVHCYKKDRATLLHLSYFCYLLPVMNYLITKLFVTDNFSACREYLTENRIKTSPMDTDLYSVLKHFGKWKLVRKHLYSVLKFTVTCYYGN